MQGNEANGQESQHSGAPPQGARQCPPTREAPRPERSGLRVWPQLRAAARELLGSGYVGILLRAGRIELAARRVLLVLDTCTADCDRPRTAQELAAAVEALRQAVGQ
jgi:hypothetical protein